MAINFPYFDILAHSYRQRADPVRAKWPGAPASARRQEQNMSAASPQPEQNVL